MQVCVPRWTGRTNNTKKTLGVCNRELFTVGPCKRIGVSCPQEPQSYWSPRLVHQSCPTLCDPMDCCPPGYSVWGILQARDLRPRDKTHMCCIAGRFFTVCAIREANPYQTNAIPCPDKKGHGPKPQLWLCKVPVLAEKRQSSADGALRARSPDSAQLSSLKGAGVQHNWPSGSSGRPKRGDQLPQTVSQADSQYQEVAEAGMGRGSPLPQGPGQG